jgi:transcriptional regulator with XRE-family HTH domain
MNLPAEVVEACIHKDRMSSTANSFTTPTGVSSASQQSPPKTPSLGKRHRNRRLLAGQTQRQAAADMGVLREVYDRWERDQTEPPVGFWTRIIAFLGYLPMPPNAGGTPDLVLMVRRVHGLSQYALGRKLGVIAKTVRLWENGSTEPDRNQLKRLHGLAEEFPTPL